MFDDAIPLCLLQAYSPTGMDHGLKEGCVTYLLKPRPQEKHAISFSDSDRLPLGAPVMFSFLAKPRVIAALLVDSINQ